MLVTVGLTPAIQRVMVFERYARGEVNRAAETHVCAAGKSINAARAARRLEPTKAIAAGGILRGASGVLCREELIREQVTDCCAEGHGDTRTCVTLIDRFTGSVTELVEESTYLAANELKLVVGRMPTASVLLCSGSFPPGCPPDAYARFAERSGAPTLIVDAKGAALLKAIEDRANGVSRIAKLNLGELLETTGSAEVERGAHQLLGLGATHVVVTDGARVVHAFDGSSHRQFTPPQIRVLNTTGCGDCLAGSMAMAIDRGDDFFDSVRIGVAASAASAETLLPAEFDPARMKELLAAIA